MNKTYREIYIDSDVVFRIDPKSEYGFFYSAATNNLFLCQPVMVRLINEEIKKGDDLSILQQMLKHLDEPDNSPIPSLHHIGIFVTERCNLSCLHCQRIAKTDGREINFQMDKLFSVIDQAIPLGLRTVGISGGEPLTWDPLLNLIEAISERGLGVSVDTNGVLLTRNIANRFAGLNVHVALSLDSHLEALHDSLRGCSGVFEKVRKAIDLLNDFQVGYTLNSCVYKENYPYVEKFLQWCKDIEVKRITLNPVVACGRGVYMKEKGQLLSLDEAILLTNLLCTINNISIVPAIPFSSLSLDFIYHNLNRGFCDLKGRLSIEPDGHLSVCGPAYLEGGVSLGCVEDSLNLAELWTTHPFFLKIRQDTSEDVKGICSKCVFLKCCRGFCKVLTYGATHEWSAPYPFCQQLYETQRFPEIYIRGD